MRARVLQSLRAVIILVPLAALAVHATAWYTGIAQGMFLALTVAWSGYLFAMAASALWIKPGFQATRLGLFMALAALFLHGVALFWFNTFSALLASLVLLGASWVLGGVLRPRT